MESIGSYGEPAAVGILKDFMKQVRASNKWDPVDCITTTLESPKQDKYSNDCAFFMLETASMLISDPVDFCDRAREDNMLTWYDSVQVHGRRKEMASMLKRMGVEQRKPGGPQASKEVVEGPVSPLQV